MKTFAIAILSVLLLVSTGDAQERKINAATEAKDQIRKLLKSQASKWNNRDLEGFMGDYLKSQNLTFVSNGIVTRGWQATLDRYKSKYTPAEMGYLTFTGIETEMMGEKAAFVLGNWNLEVNGSKSTGKFTLVMRKMHNGWKIIHDHTSSVPGLTTGSVASTGDGNNQPKTEPGGESEPTGQTAQGRKGGAKPYTEPGGGNPKPITHPPIDIGDPNAGTGGTPGFRGGEGGNGKKGG